MHHATKNHLLAMALSAALGLIAAPSAQAATIQAALTHQAGHTWQADFTVFATAAQVIESFTIYLDNGLAWDLIMLTSPADWDSLVLQPDPALLADGMFDALLLGPQGVSEHAPVAGFSMRFDWLDAAAPAPFRFTINDPLTFTVLESGFTTQAAQNIPEPATWLAAALGLVFVAAQRQRRRRT